MVDSQTTTDPDLSVLWEPVEIGPVSVKNRILDPAKTLSYAEDHVLSDRHLAFYRERARGGIGLIICEQQGAFPMAGGRGSFYRSCSALDKRSIARYQSYAEMLTEFDCVGFVQLYSPGIHDRGTLMMDDWHPVWGASQVVSNVHDVPPMVMGQKEIRSLVSAYREASQNVATSGVRGIELHGAHGYQIAQFLSPFYNQRTDRYGGTPEKRCALALEIAEAVRDQIGSQVALGIRLSFDEFMGSDGITPIDANRQLGVMADSGLFDFFNITGGAYPTLHWITASMRIREGYMREFGRRAMETVAGRARVFLVGRIVTLQTAAEIIRDGAADMVAMSRAHLVDPHLVNKAREGRADEIRHCAGINECVGRSFEQLEVVCALTPATGREQKWSHGPPPLTKKPKRILVIGGGPAGLRFAAVSAERGHRVELREATPTLGGHLRAVTLLPKREGWLSAIADFENHFARSGARLVLEHQVVGSEVLQDEWDLVVCATGAEWRRDLPSSTAPGRGAIQGHDAAWVWDVESAIHRFLTAPDELGRSIAIYDETGSYLPLGLAEMLSDFGMAVTFVTNRPNIASRVQRVQELPHVLPKLKKQKVNFITSTALRAIRQTSAVVQEQWEGSEPMEIGPFDSVALAIGRRPRTTVFDALIKHGNSESVQRIGDALAPREIAQLIYEAENLALRV